MTDTVRHAESGTAGWRDAARAIQSEHLDHGDMYALGGELSETLRALQRAARALAEQVSNYPVGRELGDDEGAPPADRLDEARVALDDAHRRLFQADRAVQEYQSAIGHIGVDTTSTED